jgi:uncharacterized membrane protein (UPF0127 family)
MRTRRDASATGNADSAGKTSRVHTPPPQKTEGFVVNETRTRILAPSGHVLRNPFRQATGTMFRNLPGAYVFVFPSPRRVAITNLFVFKPLDILWLDTNGMVLALHEHFPPFALSTNPPVRASTVIELPAGTIARTRTRVGDIVTYRETTT